MDNPHKPQTSDEETVPPPAPLPPSAQSPFRPLSRRRRDRQPAEPVSAVERPTTSPVFGASPTTVAAVLARAGRSPAEPVRLAWRRPSDGQAPVGEDSELAAGRPQPPDAA